MTQRQLVQALADSCKITRKTAKNLLDTLARTAVKEVKTNGVFILPGIGRLVRVDRSTGAPLDEPPDGSKIRFTEIEIPPPESAPKSTNKRKEPRTGGKTDWPANDAANRELGAQGEKFVFDLERHHLKGIGRADLAAQVEWTARDRGDGFGYDIRSFEDDGREKFIEVKTTNGPKSMPFLFTATELARGEALKGRYWIYRLFHFGAGVRLFRVCGPLKNRLELQPKVFVATVRRSKPGSIA